jgi:hypothetical protein
VADEVEHVELALAEAARDVLGVLLDQPGPPRPLLVAQRAGGIEVDTSIRAARRASSPCG